MNKREKAESLLNNIGAQAQDASDLLVRASELGDLNLNKKMVAMYDATEAVRVYLDSKINEHKGSGTGKV